MSKRHIQFTIAAEWPDDTAPPEIALRWLLKCMLRRYHVKAKTVQLLDAGQILPKQRKPRAGKAARPAV